MRVNILKKAFIQFERKTHLESMCIHLCPSSCQYFVVENDSDIRFKKA